MYICFPYTYTLILLLIGYSGCSDKPTDTQGSNSNEDNLPQIGGISLVDYSDSDEEDNFQVTETTQTQIEVLDEHTQTTQIETQPEHEHETTKETTDEITQTETQAEPVKDVETQTDLEQPEPQTEHPRPIQPTRYYLIEPQFQYPGYHSIYYYPPYQTPTPYQPYGTQPIQQYGPYGPQPQPIPYVQYPPIQPVPIHHPYGTPPQYYPGYLIEPITIQQPIPHIQQQQGYQPQPQAYYPVPQPEPSQTESSKVSTPKQPTEPATEKSEQQTRQQQTQSEPSKETTKEPQQEATQPTHTQPTELEPETIPVEVGSDDDEEPPKEPSGPGDGDQSPDKPEEEEDEEDEEELLCKEIKFLKKDAVGSLVELTKEECKIILNNILKVKYHVTANVEQVLCDGKIIYEHRPEKPYFQTLLYNKKNNAFVVTRPYGFLLIKNISGEWVTKRGRKIPEYIKFFRQGSVGREVEIHDRNYWVEFTSLEGFRFTFKKGVYCTKVQVANQVIWVKKFGEDHPFSVTFTAREKVIILFNGYIRIFSKGGGFYRHILTRSPNGYYQD